MGAVSNILGVANIGMGVYQSYDASKQQKREAELAAGGLEAQAARKDLEAEEALRIGDLKMAEQSVKGRADIASQKIAYVAGGVRVDSGTTMEMAADQAAWSEYERQKIRYEADLQSWGLAYDASQLRQEAAATRAAGRNSGFNWAGAIVNAGRDVLKL